MLVTCCIAYLHLNFNTKDKAQAHMDGLHVGYREGASQGVQNLPEWMLKQRVGGGASKSTPDLDAN